jgi:hypothetical protein
MHPWYAESFQRYWLDGFVDFEQARVLNLAVENLRGEQPRRKPIAGNKNPLAPSKD